MLDINEVLLMGRAARNPDIRKTESGRDLAGFTLATNRRYQRQDGEAVEETEWHRVVAWGGHAETVAKRVSKAALLIVRGRIATRRYEDAEGAERAVTEIVVAGADGSINVISPAATAAAAPPPASEEEPF